MLFHGQEMHAYFANINKFKAWNWRIMVMSNFNVLDDWFYFPLCYMSVVILCSVNQINLSIWEYEILNINPFTEQLFIILQNLYLSFQNSYIIFFSPLPLFKSHFCFSSNKAAQTKVQNKMLLENTDGFFHKINVYLC